MNRPRKCKAWRKEVLKKDNYMCEVCKRTKDLHAHHIIPWKKSVDLRFDVNNGMILCRSCHAKIEGFKKGRVLTKEQREKTKFFKKGRIPWNKGKKLTKKHIEKLKKSHIGKTPWNKGKYTPTNDVRICKICNIEKDIESFTPQGKYRSRMCKVCRNKKIKLYKQMLGEN